MKKFFGVTVGLLLFLVLIAAVDAVESPSARKYGSNIQIKTNHLSEKITTADVGTSKHVVNNTKSYTEESDQTSNKNESQKKEDNKVAYSNNNMQDKKAIHAAMKHKSTGKSKPKVALTFDDGPHPQYTQKILNALKKYKGHATFFVVGKRAEKYKSTIRKIIANGNQIGNHTYDHIKLTKLSESGIKDELNKTSDILQNIIHKRPSIIRPTYGSVNDRVKSYAGAPIILWSIDTMDWKTENKNTTINKVMGKVKDGDIVLMHDLYKTSAQAADVIIQRLSSQGYQLVTIDELFAARGEKPVNGNVYYEAYK